MNKIPLQNKLNWRMAVGLTVCVALLGVRFEGESAHGFCTTAALATKIADQPDQPLAVNTVQDSLYWRISQFYAENLDPETQNNHAWWCGSWFAIGCPGDPPEGYGNDWDQWLVWDRLTVDDPSEPVSIRVTARLNHDCEAVYDFLYLECEQSTGWWQIAAYDDVGFGIDMDVAYTIPAGELVGPDADEIAIRWRFCSDSAWSDED